MAKEIEHKYLVTDSSYLQMQSSQVEIVQGYLSREPDRTVRIRTAGNEAFITVKGRNNGLSRLEFEFAIPLEDARQMLEICEPPIIEKMRHFVPFGKFVWEVDEYLGALSGLTTAEIEVPSVDTNYPLPPFVGKEVSDDARYFNSNLTGTSSANLNIDQSK